MKKKTINEKTNSIFLFLMQSYGDSMQIPRNVTDSSQTYMDNRQILGQTREIASKSVHVSDNFLFFLVFSEKYLIFATNIKL